MKMILVDSDMQKIPLEYKRIKCLRIKKNLIFWNLKRWLYLIWIFLISILFEFPKKNHIEWLVKKIKLKINESHIPNLCLPFYLIFCVSNILGYKLFQFKQKDVRSRNHETWRHETHDGTTKAKHGKPD